MNKIVAYYTLCAVSNTKHPINSLSAADKNAFTRREIELYFRKKDGLYVPKETVVGANEVQIKVADSGNEEIPWYLRKVGGVTYAHKCIVYC
jgi:hypothetical protein